MEAVGDVGSDRERGEHKGMTAWKTEAVAGVMLPQPRNSDLEEEEEDP